jgi:hypothetical protein
VEEIRALRGTADDTAAEEPTRAAAPERPFDIREYESTARQIQAAAAELRGTIGALQGLMGSSEAAAAVGGLDAAVARGKRLVDVVAWRAVQVLVAFFTLLLVYRLAVSALERRAGRR